MTSCGCNSSFGRTLKRRSKSRSIKKSLKKSLKRRSKSRSIKKSLKRTRSKSASGTRPAKRSLVRIPVKKGMLSKYGYAISKPRQVRHQALEKASAKYGALSVFRKLNVLVTYNKNVNPVLAEKFKRDRNWVKRHLM